MSHRRALGLLALLAAALAPGLAAAQPRGFSCVGAEQLEDDVFAIPFPRGATGAGPAAEPALEAATERARANAERNICVLGHAGAAEGGASTGVRLAARRAAAIAAALTQRGIAPERVRAEARVANYSRARNAAGPDAPAPVARSVTIVLLPGG